MSNVTADENRGRQARRRECVMSQEGEEVAKPQRRQMRHGEQFASQQGEDVAKPQRRQARRVPQEGDEATKP